MSQIEKPSILVKIGGLLWFIGMSIGAFIYFGFSIVDMIKKIDITASLVIFERGVYYLPGFGVSLMSLVIVGLYEMYTKKSPSDKATKIFTRTAISGLVFMFLLPPLAENITENYLFKKGYQYCDVPTSSWPMYKDLNYTIDKKTCLAINNKEKKAWPSLYPKEDEPVFKHY